jgi:hypothetical protein
MDLIIIWALKTRSDIFLTFFFIIAIGNTKGLTPFDIDNLIDTQPTKLYARFDWIMKQDDLHGMYLRYTSGFHAYTSRKQ